MTPSGCMNSYSNTMKIFDFGLCGRAPHGSLLGLMTGVGVLALFIVAGIGMAGHINPSVMGWSLTGISGGLTTIAILGVLNEVKEKKKAALVKVIMSLVLVTLSVLAGCGILSSGTLGWCIFSPMIVGCALLPFLLMVSACWRKKSNIQNQTPENQAAKA